MKLSIEKIVFNVRGKKLELTSEEAKELKQILSDLFGETKVIHEYLTQPYRPCPWPYTLWGGTYCASATGQSAAYQGATNNADTLCLNVN